MPRKNDQKIRMAYKFFCEAEESQKRFNIDDICSATGWKRQTVESYKTKKWRSFLKEDQGKLFVQGISRYHEQNFIRAHAQRTDEDIWKLPPRFGGNIDILINKARESALLAVQAYNNPLALFRTPAYLVLMNIAYTALFHAIFENKGVDYIYINDDGTPKLKDGEKAAWELSTCINHYYGDTYCPERENLKFLITLRNKIEHRMLPQLDLTVSGHCQSMLFNFETLLKNEFGSFFALGQSLALAVQFSEIEPFQRETIKHLQTSEYELIRQFIDRYQANLPPEIQQSPQYAFRVFLIPKLGNHAKSSDVAMEFIPYDSSQPGELYDKQITMIKEQKIQVANQGKLKPSQVVERVRIATDLPFTANDHVNAWKLYKVRPQIPGPKGCDVQYCQYDEPHKDFVYTEQWVKFLIKKITDPQEFKRIKSYREERKIKKREDEVQL
jgi:hypothetical protein